MLQQLDHQALIDAAGNQRDNEATMKQAKAYRHVIGKMLCIGRMTAAIILLHASMAVSKLANFSCQHLCALASIVKRLKSQGDELHFLSPQRSETSPSTLDVVPDVPTATADDMKGRHGFIIFQRFGHIVHPIHWSAQHLRRVT